MADRFDIVIPAAGETKCLLDRARTAAVELEAFAFQQQDLYGLGVDELLDLVHRRQTVVDRARTAAEALARRPDDASRMALEAITTASAACAEVDELLIGQLAASRDRLGAELARLRSAGSAIAGYRQKAPAGARYHDGQG